MRAKDRMVAVAVAVAGALLLAASGDTLAAGKMGGAAGGFERLQSGCVTETAGKMGGVAGGIDRYASGAANGPDGTLGGRDRCEPTNSTDIVV